MKELIITDNQVEQIRIVNDGRIYAVQKIDKTIPDWCYERVIILNPREAQEIAEFIKKGEKLIRLASYPVQ